MEENESKNMFLAKFIYLAVAFIFISCFYCGKVQAFVDEEGHYIVVNVDAKDVDAAVIDKVNSFYNTGTGLYDVEVYDSNDDLGKFSFSNCLIYDSGLAYYNVVFYNSIDSTEYSYHGGLPCFRVNFSHIYDYTWSGNNTKQFMNYASSSVNKNTLSMSRFRSSHSSAGIDFYEDSNGSDILVYYSTNLIVDDFGKVCIPISSLIKFDLRINLTNGSDGSFFIFLYDSEGNEVYPLTTIGLFEGLSYGTYTYKVIPSSLDTGKYKELEGSITLTQNKTLNLTVPLLMEAQKETNLVEEMEKVEMMEVMKEIIQLLPLLLVILIGFLGLRKAIAFLIQILHKV